MKRNGDKSNVRGKRRKDKYRGIYFLGSVACLYFLVFVFKPENLQKSVKASGDMVIHILPALVFIVLLMGIMNYFVKPRTVSRYAGKGSGIKGWLLAICTGILSHGPIYAWYPLLRNLRNHGMKSSLIAVFLYNRSIKISLLPVIVYYFGLPFVAILASYLIIASIVQGHIVQMIER